MPNPTPPSLVDHVRSIEDRMLGEFKMLDERLQKMSAAFDVADSLLNDRLIRLERIILGEGAVEVPAAIEADARRAPELVLAQNELLSALRDLAKAHEAGQAAVAKAVLEAEMETSRPRSPKKPAPRMRVAKAPAPKRRR